MTDLRELEKRLEEATGPSKELDDAVFRACGLKVYPYDEPSGTTWGTAYPVTKSLDAAVALVERLLPGWGYFIRKDEEGVNASLLYPNALRVSPGCGQHQSSPALALCLALIRALIAKGDRHD